jgi:hypothetical protein
MVSIATKPAVPGALFHKQFNVRDFVIGSDPTSYLTRKIRVLNETSFSTSDVTY